MVRSLVRVTWVLGALVTIPLGAQDRARETNALAVPASAMPPAGLCRVWLKDVPAMQQPAPTDCAVAIRKRPPTAQVLFGEPRSDAVTTRTQGYIMSGSTIRVSDSPSRAVNLLPRAAGAPSMSAAPLAAGSAETPRHGKPPEKPQEEQQS